MGFLPPPGGGLGWGSSPGREGARGWVTNAKNKYAFFQIFLIFIGSEIIFVYTH